MYFFPLNTPVAYSHQYPSVATCFVLF